MELRFWRSSTRHAIGNEYWAENAGTRIAEQVLLALCCDFVVMAEDARIGYPPARVWFEEAAIVPRGRAQVAFELAGQRAGQTKSSLRLASAEHFPQNDDILPVLRAVRGLLRPQDVF